ncbi:MAG TPA: TIGR00366 family protein [Arthrobacter sp.]
MSIADSFGNGFWDLTAFTLQMAMAVLTGYVVASSPPVAKLINRLALVPSTARMAGAGGHGGRVLRRIPAPQLPITPR